MASVRQRGKKKAWYALFRDGKGVLVQRRTKAKTRREAEDLAAEMERLSRPTQSQITVENMRRVIADLHRKYLGTEAPKMTVRDYFTHWLGMKENEVGQESLEKYRNATRWFLEHLGKRADDDLFAVTKQDVVQWRDGERKRVGPVSVNQSLKILRMIFRAARADEWTPENPTQDVKLVKEDVATSEEKVSARSFTLQELVHVLKVIEEKIVEAEQEHDDQTKAEWLEWRAMIIRGLFTGQRLRDICLMRANQEDVVRQQVKFRTSKTGRLVLTPMHPEYVDWVLTLPSTDDPKAPLHPIAFASVTEKIKRKAKSKTATQSNQFTRILADAGLRKKDTHRMQSEPGHGRNARRKRSPLTFHSLRHTWTSLLAEAGVSQQLIKDIVGHETDDANASYTHFPQAVKKEAVLKLASVFGSLNRSRPASRDGAGG